jgi:predicted small metal-binding protein
MTTVKCPICKDRVSGASTANLNDNLREHLASVHQMRELSMGTRGAMPSEQYYTSRSAMERPMEREQVREERMEPEERRRSKARDYPYIERRPSTGMFSAPETRTERVVETWSNRDPERFRTENYVPREEVRQWRYPVTGPMGERGPTSSERLREERRREEAAPERREGYMERRTGMMRRESDMPATVNCPLCGNLVRGRDEDDLSDELRDHMADTHDIRPKMAARYRS